MSKVIVHHDEFVPDIDAKKKLEDEIFKFAVRIKNGWESNLREGSGILSHGRPYVNTGEAVSSIQLEPNRAGSDNYIIFSDKMQTLIAEVGREPGGKMPPKAAIENWVHEQLGIGFDESDFDSIVYAVRRNIAKFGLDPFMPMEKALVDVVAELEKKLGEASEPEN